MLIRAQHGKCVLISGTPGRRDPMTQTAPGEAGPTVRHPLAPLTVDEAAAAGQLALAGFGPGARLVYCALDEPPKETVLGWDGDAVPRQLLCVVYEKPARMTW